MPTVELRLQFPTHVLTLPAPDAEHFIVGARLVRDECFPKETRGTWQIVSIEDGVITTKMIPPLTSEDLDAIMVEHRRRYDEGR